MRLLFVTPNFPPVLGGMQSYSLELARRLAPHVAHLEVLTTRAEGSDAIDRDLPFPITRMPETADNMAVAGAPWVIERARKGRFDAAFCVHWSAALPALAARKLGLLRHVYCAAHGRELLIRPLARVPAAQRAYDAARNAALAGVDRFFPVSHYTGGLLAERGVEASRIVVVPNGVDPDRYRPVDVGELKRELGLEDRKVVLTVARLVPRKGIDTVLAALPEVRRTVPDLAYLVVGEGPDRERLEGLAREHGVHDVVRFMGRRAFEMLPRYYGLCDVFALPARSVPPDVEGFGLVLLEASACGKPVIGARDGGVPDAVIEGETGLLVPPNDPGALARALTMLLADPALRRRMGERGREHATTRGTWERAADTITLAMHR